MQTLIKELDKNGKPTVPKLARNYCNRYSSILTQHYDWLRKQRKEAADARRYENRRGET